MKGIFFIDMGHARSFALGAKSGAFLPSSFCGFMQRRPPLCPPSPSFAPWFLEFRDKGDVFRGGIQWRANPVTFGFQTCMKQETCRNSQGGLRQASQNS